MKVCITAKDNGEGAQIDPRFGRCAWFCFYDSETGEKSFEENGFTHERGGVGVQASQHMLTNGVEAVLTGQVGPNAYRALSAAGVKIYTGFTGTVADGIKKYHDGGIEAAGGPTNEGHVV